MAVMPVVTPFVFRPFTAFMVLVVAVLVVAVLVAAVLVAAVLVAAVATGVVAAPLGVVVHQFAHLTVRGGCFARAAHTPEVRLLLWGESGSARQLVGDLLQAVLAGGSMQAVLSGRSLLR